MVKVVVGLMGSSASKGSASISTSSGVQGFLDVCKANQVDELDTARVYAQGKSEELLGEVKATDQFFVATKAPGFGPGCHKYENVITACQASLKALQTQTIPLYYVHGPDPSGESLDGLCKAMNDLHSQGKINSWGMSNLSVEQVDKIHEICSTNRYPQPCAYQGGYNAVNRDSESALLPLLRKLNISYYVYSPLAGGLLAKSIEQILSPEASSRYSQMPVFASIYAKPFILQALKDCTKTCTQANLPIMEASLRWLKHHAPLQDHDAIILGASSIDQLNATLHAIRKGPLDKGIVDAFEEMWKEIRKGAA